MAQLSWADVSSSARSKSPGTPRRRGWLGVGLRRKVVACLAVASAVALFALLLVVTPGGAQGPPTIAQQVAVPAYINPDASPATWAQLTATATTTVGFVVANIENGPNYGGDPGWASVLGSEHAEGVKVLGYVDTGYLGTTGNLTRLGSTATADWISQIEEDVNAWYANYGPDLSGIFFDDAQNACGPTPGSDAWSDTYSYLTAYVKSNHPGAMTVDNPGEAVPQCYQDAADVLVTFEGDYSSYTNAFTALSWSPVDPKKIWHIVYDVPTSADMEGVVALSKERGAGYVFVTDATLPNPYDTLPEPAYWDDEVTQMPPGNSPGSVPPSTPTGLSASSVGSSEMTIGWDASAPGSQAAAAYDVYSDGVWLTSVPGDATSYTATDLEPSTVYDFSVSARDAYGNVSGMSAQLAESTSAAETAPSVPQDVSTSATTYTSTELTWTASTTDPNDAVAGYEVYVNGAEALTVPGSVTSVTVGGLASGGATYSFSVQAMDASGSLSAQSSPSVATTEPTPGGQMITSPSETTSAGILTYSADYLMPFAFRRVFIDTGSTPCFYTGADPQICANYVIENAVLYSYVGDGTDWEVSIGIPLSPSINGYQYSWTVPATDLGSPSAQQYVFNGQGYAPLSYSGEVTGQAPQTLTPEVSGGPNSSPPTACLPSANAATNPAGAYSVSLTTTDLTVPGTGPELDLERTYSSSLASTLGPFGYGWADSYAMSIAPDPTCGPTVMDVTLGDGSVVSFAQEPDGSWLSLSPAPASLGQNPAGTWTFTYDNESFVFSSSGQLTSESDPDGATTTLSYTDGVLTTVTDPAGRTLTFSYWGPLVTQVTASGGQSVTYSYRDGNLSQVTDVDGGAWSYEYGWHHQLDFVTTPDEDEDLN
jgi:hypothetical protein